jgi:hypothetical protein
MGITTERSRCGRIPPLGGLRCVIVLVVLAGAARAAHADDDSGGKPWFPMVDPRANPSEIYDLNELEVIHVGSDGWRVNRGKYRESVSRHDFFVTVGRTDLAARESTDRAIGVALVWSGVVAAGLGTWMLYAHFSPGGLDPPPAAGLGLMVGGGLAAIIGSGWSGPSVAPEEVDGITRRYNEQLKAHIEGDTGAPTPVQARLAPPTVAPWSDGRSGFGLVALGRF